MCKGCQYGLEYCWWHLIEKRFCFDDSIALYQESDFIEDKSNNNIFDNMSFYDQVKVIAGRSIVTIEPLSTKPRPIEHQPKPKRRWFEDVIEIEDKEIVSKSINVKPPPKIITTISDDVPQDIDQSDGPTVIRRSKPTSVEVHHSSSEENLTLQIPIKQNYPNEIVKSATSPNILAPSTLVISIVEAERARKKSLRERRMSRSLTLNIDKNNVELPVFRHTSMPKFYLDTPEVNQIDSSAFLMAPSSALTSPILPRNSDSGFFDLRSIVQIEIENRAHQPPPPLLKQQSSSRLSQIKERLKSTKLKKSGSATNLPNSIQHI